MRILPSKRPHVLYGTYSTFITSTIVDCRYPYGYNAGHIKGAINLWSKANVKEHFLAQLTCQNNGESRRILNFHCEFSSKRGPSIIRYLRGEDCKAIGLENYPKLYYPEVYLLVGGYNAFYKQFPELCEPRGYCKMDHPDYKK